MALLGKALEVTGTVTGTVLEYGIKATGEVVGMVAQSSDNYELADKSRKIGKNVGEFVGKSTKVAGKGAGMAVDKAVDIGSDVGEGIGGYIAKAKELDENETIKAKTIGRVIGGGVVGFAVGDTIGGTITAGATISSLHGAAQTSNALAHIGGGAISAGGGGMAAGQAILHGIDGVSTIAGGIDGAKKNTESKRNDGTDVNVYTHNPEFDAFDKEVDATAKLKNIMDLILEKGSDADKARMDNVKDEDKIEVCLDILDTIENNTAANGDIRNNEAAEDAIEELESLASKAKKLGNKVWTGLCELATKVFNFCKELVSEPGNFVKFILGI